MIKRKRDRKREKERERKREKKRERKRERGRERLLPVFTMLIPNKTINTDTQLRNQYH